MHKVRVLQIVGNPIGGIRKHVHDIINGLSDSFDMFYISSKNGDRVYFTEIDNLLSKISANLILNIKKRPALSDLFNIVRICRFIKQNNIDVVHGHGAKGGLYARICGKYMKCKVIYTPHGGVVHNMFSKTEDLIYTFIEKLLCKFTDLLIFESKYTSRKFKIKFGCSDVKYIINYNGVTLPLNFHVKTKEVTKLNDRIKIGVFGVIRKQKGQNLALDAVRSLIQEGFNIELHFYGDGQLSKQLQINVTKFNLQNNVYFHGEVDNVYKYMDFMDFILIPSLFESFGYVAVEAMLSYKIIISSDAGGLSEVLSDETAFLFTSGDCECMEGAIKKAILATITELNSKMTAGEKKAVDLFSLNRMLSTLKSIYSINL